MARLMDIGLEKLTRLVLDMGGLAEKSVATSIQAYVEGKNLVEQIHDWSEELRRLQDEVSELAVEIIARYQPVASDLRFIKACMEIAYGFSRFGRYAYDIAEVLQIWGNLSNCDHTKVEEIAEVTRKMIEMSVDAFARKDVNIGLQIEKMDDLVDNGLRDTMAKLKTSPGEDPRCDMSAILIMRYLERIADHASYIGESVSYVVTGQRSPRK